MDGIIISAVAMAKKTNKRNDDRQTGGDDPVLLMLAVGKQLWEQESGDAFIERLRSETAPPAIRPDNLTQRR